MSSVLTCELSGETIVGGDTAVVVVTPSGHVCLKRLLLQQLTTNGGKDPFESDRPLAEDDLVELKAPKVLVPPPRTANFAHTLEQLQKDYDAVLLELFDTRKVLSETREELSQALYQNDAAVRVIARLSAECDQARAALKEGGGKRMAEADDSTEPASKKLKKLDIPSSISENDFALMSQKWEELHGSRKAKQKMLAKEAPSFAAIQEATPKIVSLGTTSTVSTENSTTALATLDEDTLVFASGPSAVVVAKGEPKPEAKLDTTSQATAVTAFAHDDLVMGLADGSVYRMRSGASPSLLDVIDGSTIVAAVAHPDHAHYVVATAKGCVALAQAAEWVAAFYSSSDITYTTGTLHPDGLIFIAGSSTGNLHYWDFKNQSLGGSMDYTAGAVVSVAFSNNGYYIAAVYSNDHVLVWDLRKQTIVTTLNQGGELAAVASVTFDESGKYLAFSGQSEKGIAVRVIVVKKWDQCVTIQGPKSGKACNGLTWNKNIIAVSCLDGDKPQLVEFNVSGSG